MTPQLTGVMSGMSGTSVSSALSGEIQCSATAVFGAETCTVSAFGIPIQLNDYSGNIFVPLLMAAVLAVVYRGLKRVIPDSVQLVFVPFPLTGRRFCAHHTGYRASGNMARQRAGSGHSMA